MKKLKLPFLYLLSFILSLGPVAIFVALHIESYISTPADAIRLTAGGLIVALILLLKILAKLKIPSRITVFSFVFVLSYLLNPLIRDICILSFLALLGEGLDMILGAFIKREREKEATEKIAKETVTRLEKIIPRS